MEVIMRVLIFMVIMTISLNCFAQFNEPIQINEQNVAIIAGQDAYKVIGENIYITYKEEYYSHL